MGSSKAATTTTSPNAAPDASSLIQNANVVANQNPFEAYSGQFVAPMTADQYAALGAITGAPGVAGPYLQNATDLYGNASGMVGAGASYLPGAAGLIDQGASYLPGAAGMISAAPGEFGQSSAYAQQGTTPLQNLIPGLMSPYTQDVVDATQNQFNNQNSVQSNALLGQAIQAGNAFGGDREGIAQAQLANQQQMAEAPVIAGLYNQGFQTALGGAEQQNAEALQAAGIANQTGAGMVGAGSAYGNVGLGLGSLGSQYGNVGLGLGNLGATQAGVGTQYGNLGLSAAGQQLQAGVSGFNASTLEQQTQQAQDTALYNQFLAQQGFPYAQQSWLGQQSAMLYPALGGTSTATPAFNPLSTAVGAGLFGAALPSSSVGGSALTSLFGLSDKRVKENIEPVGKTYSGDTVYRFNFKGDPRTQIGLLAQNVERKTPGVVGHDASGIKYLDYKGATDRAAHKGHFQGGGGVAPFQQGVLTPPNIFGKNPYIPVGNIPHGNISIQTAQAVPEPTFNDFLKAGTKFGSSSKSASQNSNISTIDSTVGGTDSIAVDPEYRGGVVGYDDGGSVDPSSYEYLASIASPLGSELSADRSIEAALSPLRRGGVAGYATDGAVTDDADTTPVDTNINTGVAPLPPAQDVAEVKVAGQDPWAPYMSKIEETEKKYGLPAGYLAQTGRIENASANPSEKSPTGATGLYQFIGSTAKQYGVNPRDANSSIEGAGRYGADIKRALEDAGLPATASNIYLGHNQGIDGAIALLRNPDLPAGVVTKPENIRVNGGNPSAPASQFINKFASKFDDNEGVATPLSYADDKDSGVSTRQRLVQATSNTKSDASNVSNSIFGRLFGVSREGNQAIMAAGAAMMAGQSPWAMQNIGHGIMAGMGTYQSAEHLSQTAQKMQNDLDMASRRQTETEKYHRDLTDIHREQLQREQIQPITGYETPDGHPVAYDKHSGKTFDMLTHKEIDPDTGVKNTKLQWKPFPNKVTDTGNPVMFNGQGQFMDATTHEVLGTGSKIVDSKVQGVSDDQVKARGYMLALGDAKGAYAGFGYGNNPNRGRVYDAALKRLTEEGGMSTQQAGEYLSQQDQEWHARGIGLGAEARTAATREANLNIILRAADAAVPAALEASKDVWRSGFVPLNEIVKRVNMGTANAAENTFGMANLQLAEHWARAMNPTGVMRESDRDLALGFLNTATSTDTYKSNVKQLQKQIGREKTAVQDFRKSHGSGATLGSENGLTYDKAKEELVPAAAVSTPAAATAIPSPDKREKDRVYDTPKGKLKWTGTGWVQP